MLTLRGPSWKIPGRFYGVGLPAQLALAARGVVRKRDDGEAIVCGAIEAVSHGFAARVPQTVDGRGPLSARVDPGWSECGAWGDLSGESITFPPTFRMRLRKLVPFPSANSYGRADGILANHLIQMP